ncbi:MAG: hypothetical protein KF864_06565 [Phycisphaeraceae bacterium]|nr:hypothetical protein [Phycisphaeraceae bacterium]
MGLLLGLVGGTVGGVVGAAIWAFIAYTTSYEVGWIAWGVGVLSGVGMALGTRKDTSMLTGILAAVIALVAVLAGKYIAITYMVNDHMPSSLSITISNNDIQVHLADQLVEEYQQAGKPVVWPEGMTVEKAATEADYPKNLWADMLTRWNALAPEDIEQRREFLTEESKQSLSQAKSLVAEDAFTESFSLFDALWFILAIGSAYKIGSGSGEDE